MKGEMSILSQIERRKDPKTEKSGTSQMSLIFQVPKRN